MRTQAATTAESTWLRYRRDPDRVEDLAGILTIPRQDPRAVVAALAEQRIIVDHRPGLIRLSPYFYNTFDDCDGVVQAIAELERRGIA